jgi:hypothetical protein
MANKVNLFVSSVLFDFWYHSLNILDTLHICNISCLRVKQDNVVYFVSSDGLYNTLIMNEYLLIYSVVLI